MTSNRFFIAGLAIVFAAALSPSAVLAQDFNATPPNASWQEPAFTGQTRAPVIDETIELKQETIVDGLRNPWGVDELPGGGWIITERQGAMRLADPEGALSRPIDGLPEVDARGQGGLLDVVVRDDFQSTRRVWWSYAEPRGGGANATAVATGVLSPSGEAMTEVKVIFRQEPAWVSTKHYGSRLVFDREGALFVTTGERSDPEPRQLAQDVGTTLGKVVRINPEGGPAAGNPEIPGGLPEIWSYGHRNLQSAAIAPDGALWTVEHGPRGGDELNRPEPGLNYGWPVITYGENYSGARVGEGLTQMEGMQQPVYYWDPVIAPSGMAFYEGAMFPDWRGSVLIGGLRGQALVRLVIEDGKVRGEARYLQGEARIRDVDVAQDGAVMILTDGSSGALIRLEPDA
ncbi:PQQ-dependent sugar dehydrogenase [Hoeflea sp. WL0058]|uniref:PQQ-dependent sugar dehydrogenase n=2 Tax=Flavimaribacter sediminis TaxID=2865987 RepID=A0AAE3D1Y9_9HYPH|nr:PQQ-dependent sugar dehydrogenase [Flavimaribacter sediminis]MBW8638422.1 PQQ-dependent sugar dehydrogenase [Flavimaribacter sediminis]